MVCIYVRIRVKYVWYLQKKKQKRTRCCDDVIVPFFFLVEASKEQSLKRKADLKKEKIVLFHYYYHFLTYLYEDYNTNVLIYFYTYHSHRLIPSDTKKRKKKKDIKFCEMNFLFCGWPATTMILNYANIRSFLRQGDTIQFNLYIDIEIK